MRTSAVDANISRRLRRRREGLGVSLEELSRRTGVAAERLAAFEQAGRRIPAAMLLTLANALDIDIDYFFEGLSRTAPAARPPGLGLS